VVGGRDGGDQGEAESGAVVPGAVVQPGEGLEQVGDLLRRDHRPAVDHAQHGLGLAGGRRDRDGPPVGVVALGVVEQVDDEPLEQHGVAGHRRFPERGGNGDAGRGAAVQGVLGDGGQVEGLGAGGLVVGAGQDEQRVDEPLAVPDRLADLGGHGDQFVDRRARLGQDDVGSGAHQGQGGAQFVAGVGDELALGAERAVEALQHRVEGVGQLAELVARALQGDALRQVVLGGGAGGGGELVDRAQDPPGGEPAHDGREHGDHGQAEQGVGQQVGQGGGALRAGAGLDTLGIQRGALARGRRPAGLGRVKAPADLQLDRRRDSPDGPGVAQGVGDQQVGGGDQRGAAEGEQGGVQHGEPGAGAQPGAGGQAGHRR